MNNMKDAMSDIEREIKIARINMIIQITNTFVFFVVSITALMYPNTFGIIYLILICWLFGNPLTADYIPFFNRNKIKKRRKKFFPANINELIDERIAFCESIIDNKNISVENQRFIYDLKYLKEIQFDKPHLFRTRAMKLLDKLIRSLPDQCYINGQPISQEAVDYCEEMLQALMAIWYTVAGNNYCFYCIEK